MNCKVRSKGYLVASRNRVFKAKKGKGSYARKDRTRKERE